MIIKVINFAKDASSTGKTLAKCSDANAILKFYGKTIVNQYCIYRTDIIQDFL